MRAPEGEAVTGSAAAIAVQVDLLRNEITSAIGAISENSFPALQDSLTRQEVLCGALNHLLKALGEERVSQSTTIRLRETMNALRQLNKSYELVVQQSRASNDLLHRLSNHFGDLATVSHVHATARYSVEA